MQSSVNSIRDDLFDQLCDSINREFVNNDSAPPFTEWVKGVTLDGKPFTYNRHEYLVEPYADDHPFQVEEKAAQLGLTTRAMLRALYLCRYANFRGVLYLFPSKTDALDFSKSRIAALIDENPDDIGIWLKDTDSAGLKKVWDSWLYVRGMQSQVGLKSIPCDFVIFDELSEAPMNAVDVALERMGHSEHRLIHQLSNPTLPDYGICKAFQQTDQRYWLLKCEACGHYTCMEDIFCQAKPPETPRCLVETSEGRVFRACEKCQAELNPSTGQWVAKRPRVTDRRGYHYSQLFSHYIEPGDILRQYRTTNNLTAFYNLKIGVGYVEAQNRLSVPEVLALCGSEGIASSDPGPCFMGVDQGKDLHVVIGRRGQGEAGAIIHMGVYRDWQELDRLLNAFNVARCVVDALPETRNARAFAERFRGKAYLNYYQEHRKGHYAWNDKELTVSCNRTESLDASHREIMDQAITLPKECEITQEFAQHLHNVAKRLEENEETGSKRYVYVKLGPDHFRHAFNYEAMARQFGADSLFGNCDLS